MTRIRIADIPQELKKLLVAFSNKSTKNVTLVHVARICDQLWNLEPTKVGNDEEFYASIKNQPVLCQLIVDVLSITIDSYEISRRQPIEAQPTAGAVEQNSESRTDGNLIRAISNEACVRKLQQFLSSM